MRPNLLLFMPDQLRADAVGAFGNAVARTPHIDALADRGTVFENAFSQHSVCSPSRVSMFTGWYPHVAGHRTLTHLLQPHQPNVFKRLKDGGYHVAMAGARGDMMAPGVTEASADRWGFDPKPSLEALAAAHRSPFAADHKWFAAFYNGKVTVDGLDFDEAAVQTSIRWLTDGLPEPWCLFIPLVFPHPPFAVESPWFEQHDRAKMPPPTPPPPDFLGKPRFIRTIHERSGLGRLDAGDWAEVIATYYGMVSRVDDQLGRVLAALDQAGAADRTVTFFFTDHGEYLGDFGLVEKWPSGLDDCLLRNPLVIHDPTASAGRAGAMVELVDLAATIEDFAELEPSHTHFGRSLRGLLRDPDGGHRRMAFSEGGFMIDEEPLFEAGADGLYANKQALQHEQPALLGRAISVRTPQWTYIERLYESPELYDRSQDPHETVNVAGLPAHEPIERELKDRVFRWLFETSDVIPWTPDPRLDRTLQKTFRPD